MPLGPTHIGFICPKLWFISKNNRRCSCQFCNKYCLFGPRREHLSLLREFSRLYVKFRASVQILFRAVLRSQFRKVVKTTCRILQILQSVTRPNGTVPRLPTRGLNFFPAPTDEPNHAVSSRLAHPDLAAARADDHRGKAPARRSQRVRGCWRR